MKTLLLITALFLFTSGSFASGGKIFLTYQDYVNNTGAEFDEYLYYNTAGTQITMVFEQGGKKIKLQCREMWGFTYKDALFRMYHADRYANSPLMLVNVGKLCYYENGVAHLEILKGKTTKMSYTDGSSCAFSETLESEMIGIGAGFDTKEVKDLTAGLAGGAEFFDCIKSIFAPDKIRACVLSFEGKDEF